MAQVAPAGTLSRLDALLSTRGRDLPAPRIGDPSGTADTISFVFGFPDPASLPASSIAESTVTAMQNEGEHALQYGRDKGVPKLADALLAKLKKDQDIVATRDEVMITAGGSQACQLVLDLLLDPGDTILVEAPTWMGFLYMVNNLKGNAIGVPVDENGTDVDALEAELKRLKAEGITPKLFYTIPNFQNPSGVSTSVERRKRIVELAQEYGIVVLEDDAYHDLRYSGEHLPPIYTMDDSGLVWYTGTFSKIVGAGMRLGWLVAPTEVITKISVLKTDGCTNVFGSHVAADWLPTHLDDHIETLKGIYKTRRDIMLDSIEKHLPSGTTWNVPDGGFFIWVTLPEGLNMTTLRAQSKEIGVDYLPGSTCYT
ncbi:MAG: PLP-dependent aminotransferase family protein, partial [Thermomicrobiales bacterium]